MKSASSCIVDTEPSNTHQKFIVFKFIDDELCSCDDCAKSFIVFQDDVIFQLLNSTSSHSIIDVASTNGATNSFILAELYVF
jgi:hypothetical protein